MTPRRMTSQTGSLALSGGVQSYEDLKYANANLDLPDCNRAGTPLLLQH